MNVFTAKRLQGGKIPLLVEDEIQAMQVLLNFRQDDAPGGLRLAWIRNTAMLDEMWVSSALLAEARENPNVEILCEPGPISYDEARRLVAPGLSRAA